MKKFLEELKGARRFELFLALFAAAVLLLAQLQDGTDVVPEQTETEKKLASLLSCIDGAGKVEVMIAEDGYSGAVIVTEGAGDLYVCLRIQQAVQTLLGTSTSRIEIVPYRE